MPDAFDETKWIARLGQELERIAGRAEPVFFAVGEVPTPGATIEEMFREVARAARREAGAAKLFSEASFQLDAEPVVAKSLLRDHPLLAQGLTDRGDVDEVGFVVLNTGRTVALDTLVATLAKLAVRDGGECIAERVHRYLSEGNGPGIPGHEILVIHGLDLDTCLELGRGAFLAPYAEVRERFGLSEKDSMWFSFDRPESGDGGDRLSPSVLVRRLRYRPGLYVGGEMPFSELVASFEFPGPHEVSGEAWPADSRMLADVFSVSAGTPLLCRTCYFRLDDWAAELDRNIAFGSHGGHGYPSDVWPEGRTVGADEALAFADMARGWLTCREQHGSVDLVVRRLARSCSRPASKFGVEDRIVDVAIVLEALCGSSNGQKLGQRAAGLLGRDDGEHVAVYDTVKAFHDMRNAIVHADRPSPGDEDMERGVEEGMEAARRMLRGLFALGGEVDWAKVTVPIDEVRRRHRDATQRSS